MSIIMNPPPLSRRQEKRLRRIVKEETRKESLSYMNNLLRNKNFWGRLQIAWGIMKCKI